MAVRPTKDQLLEEAQKLVLRGQFDKAAKLYEQLLAFEPSSISRRQKLAEILLKAGRSEDARREFETIGEHFANNGFYLKSIAVYKQLQKLFPEDITLSITLAGLNEKHGLTANALSEYKHVYDYYVKQGNLQESLKILDKMQVADPQNISVKIKLAEAYFQEGDKEESYTLFGKTASLLRDRGDSAAVSKLNARIMQLFPDKHEFMLDLLAEQVMSGNAASAVDGLQGLLRTNSKDKRIWDLIVEAYKRLEQPKRVKVVCQHYLRMLPDEPAAMSGLLLCSAAERDLNGTMELLGLYENRLLSAGLFEVLEKVYRNLYEIDPLNINLLEGLIRVAGAAGNDGEVTLLSDRLKSLSKVSDNTQVEPTVLEAEPCIPEEEVSDEANPETGQQAPEPDDLSSLSEDIEIELDIDDLPSGSANEKGAGETFDSNNWLDSVTALFDNIATAPSGVRYGNVMDGSDSQSHYDLGLAFKEMGLYDEAIKEFRKASSDTDRRMACLIMQGACLRERGEFDTAINMLSALLKPGLGIDDSCAVKYELFLTYEALGRTDEATQLLNEIDSAAPDFRDVSSRLNASTLENSLDFSDDDLKNF